jgi:serine/threonine protein phosphatase PrpC
MCIIIGLQLVTLIVILALPQRLKNIKTHILEQDTMSKPPREIQSNEEQVSVRDKSVSPSVQSSELGQEPMPLLRGFQVFITRPKTKNGENQDAGICGLRNDKRYRFVAVADGVGMAKNSSVASETIVTAFGEYIGRLQATAQIPMENEMRKFYSLATLRMKQRLEQKELSLDSAATTFIGLVESSNRYVLTYLADGSVYQITQSNDGYNISAVQRLLTSASPDVPPQIGATGKSDEPSIEIYAKGTLEGSMWIVATDGLNDLERYLDDGKTKVSGPKAAEHLADEIWQSFRESPSRFDEETIEAILWRWLKKCQSTDDATIAILISGEMYAHWQKLAAQSKTGRLELH